MAKDAKYAMLIYGAREGNLKNLDVAIPRNQLVVLTGLSGSGKSTLALDVLFMEAQRQYLEAMGFQGIAKPKIEEARNLSPAIRITPGEAQRNPRSTVGTLTNLYTDLRMIFEKLAQRPCPACKEMIRAGECKEEVEKTAEDFLVFMYCTHCGHRMEKLTRTHFSFNTREGACPICHGLGEVLDVDLPAVLKEDLSLAEGAVDFWDHAYRDYQVKSVDSAFQYYGEPPSGDTPVRDFTPGQRALLLYGAESENVKALYPGKEVPKRVTDGRFEGLLTTLWRRLEDKGGNPGNLSAYFKTSPCGECHGEKLSSLPRQATVQGRRLPELSRESFQGLQQWLIAFQAELSPKSVELVRPYVEDLATKIRRIRAVGLSYLTSDRAMRTLSGGETQRLRLSILLDSTMEGLLYILDEPTVGLHPEDTQGILAILKGLRDKGNSVLVIEHDPEVMTQADHILDLGPGAGKHGGELVAEGSLEEIRKNPRSVTGAYLNRQGSFSLSRRPWPTETFDIRHARRNNLQDLSLELPVGRLISITGVSGSGKSTLVLDVLSGGDTPPGRTEDIVEGCAVFPHIVTVEQAPLTRMKRSNVATYTGLYSEIRKIFSSLPQAKAQGLQAGDFSFNTPGGRCERCEGLGTISSNMLFFADIDVVCPQCEGQQFSPEVLQVTYKGHSVHQVLRCSVEEALELFHGHGRLIKDLTLLKEVGLGYLELGQTLTTLSGGEGQRLKLAKELLGSKGKKGLYLLDEPTTGLHPVDVENFLKLLQKMVDEGNTVVVIEHQLQVVASSDWVVDLGPLGGEQGGRILVQGTPETVAACPESYTGHHLKNLLSGGKDDKSSGKGSPGK